MTKSSMLLFIWILLFQMGACSPSVCYDDVQSRLKPLRGSWGDVTNQSFASQLPFGNYFNLSCPFEWSKYSCVHQGALRRAELTRNRVFVPDDGCQLLSPSLDDMYLFGDNSRNRTLHFHGDSLLRQVMTSLGCILNQKQLVNHHFTSVGWKECPLKFPCHGTKNCVPCGQHSGYDHADIVLKSGAKLKYLWTGKGLQYGALDEIKTGDVLILESGIHGNTLHTTEKMLRIHKDLIDNREIYVIWLITPQDAFMTLSGSYSPNNIDWKTHLCRKNSIPVRSRDEWIGLHRHNDTFKHLHGIIELEQLENQGDCKVGNGVGKDGDCAHYCMPGPTDVLASALYTQLTRVLRDVVNDI